MTEPKATEPIRPEDILIVRRGPGANCSSIGSTLDLLFLSAALAGAIFAGIAATLADEEVGARARTDDDKRKGKDDESAR